MEPWPLALLGIVCTLDWGRGYIEELGPAPTSQKSPSSFLLQFSGRGMEEKRARSCLPLGKVVCVLFTRCLQIPQSLQPCSASLCHTLQNIIV